MPHIRSLDSLIGDERPRTPPPMCTLSDVESPAAARRDDGLREDDDELLPADEGEPSVEREPLGRLPLHKPPVDAAEARASHSEQRAAQLERTLRLAQMVLERRRAHSQASDALPSSARASLFGYEGGVDGERGRGERAELTSTVPAAAVGSDSTENAPEAVQEQSSGAPAHSG